MGERGPAPTPTNIRLLHGETRPSQINYNEPKPGQMPVEPPGDISEQAKEIWDKYAPDLIRVGVLTPWDVEDFRAWCDAVVSGREAQAELDENGEVIDQPMIDRNGKFQGYRQIINPWWKVRMEAGARQTALGSRFGMTPADRTRIRLGDSGGKGKNAQDNSDLLSG